MEMFHAIDETIGDESDSDLHHSKFSGIIVDETTDVDLCNGRKEKFENI